MKYFPAAILILICLTARASLPTVEPSPPSPPERPRSVEMGYAAFSAAGIEPGLPDETGRASAAHSICVNLLSIWEKRRRFLAAYNEPAARVAEQQIISLKEKASISNLLEYSAVMLIEARTVFNSGRAQRALELADTAIKLSPDMPEARFVLSEILRKSEEAKAMDYLSALSSAVTAAIHDFRFLGAAALNLWFLVAASLLAAIVAFTAVLLLRRIRYFFHFIGHLLPGGMHPAFGPLCTLLVLAAAPAAGTGILLTACFWIALMLPYGTRGERAAGLVSIMLIAAIPTAADAFSTTVAGIYGRGMDLYLLNYNGCSEAAARRMEASRSSSDFSGPFSLAKYYRQAGDLRKAIELSSAALDLEPSAPAVLNNLAVSVYGGGDSARAVDLLEQAVKADTSIAVPHHNLSLIHYSQDDVAAGAKESNAADSLDTGRIPGHAFRNGVLLEMVLTPRQIFKLSVGVPASTEPSRAGAELWNAFERAAWSGREVLLAGIAMLVALAGMLLQSSTARVASCGMCGRTICGKCSGRAFADEPLCGKCHDIFVTGEVADPSLKLGIEYEQRRIRLFSFLGPLLLNLPAPGLGQLAAGRALRGMILFASFALCVLYIVSGGGVLANPVPVMLDPVLKYFLPSLAILICLLASILDAISLKRR